MPLTKDTVCTMTVTIAINDGEKRSSVDVKLPQFRAEHAQMAFKQVQWKLGEAARDIAIFDIMLLDQQGEVQVVDLN
jgi:hypothetical protein